MLYSLRKGNDFFLSIEKKNLPYLRASNKEKFFD